MSSKGRPSRRPVSTAALFAASLCIHAVVVVSVGTIRGTVSAPSAASLADLAAAKPPELSFAFSCAVDVGAFTVAHLLTCLAPTEADRGECADEIVDRFANEQILCEMQKTDLPRLARAKAAEVRLVDASELAKIKPEPIIPALPPKQQSEVEKQQLEEVAQKQEELRKQEMNPSPSAQVVEITPPKVEIAPDKARFVSEYDSKVDKETVARNGTDKMVEKPGPQESVASLNRNFIQPIETAARPSEADGAGDGKQGRAGKEGAPGLFSMRGQSAANRFLDKADTPGSQEGERLSSSDGYRAMRGGQNTRTPEPKEGRSGDGGENGGGGPTSPNLMPTQDMFDRMVGGGSVDKLDGVEQGIGTSLNSRRWKYAGFFNRMKRRVAENWHPAEVFMRRDPTGRVYGTKDRKTILQISLNPNGTLARVFIIESSGVDFLDDEAMSAFRKAQPFPNPPKALIEDGEISFSFGFHFQIDGRTDSWRVFRYR